MNSPLLQRLQRRAGEFQFAQNLDTRAPGVGAGAEILAVPEPGVVEDLLEAYALLSVDPEAAADEVLALWAQLPPEHQLGAADLLISLVRDVATDHVVEEDAQGPDSHRLVHFNVLLENPQEISCF